MQNNHLLKKAILTLLLCVAMPILNAQVVHIGDILCEGDLIVSPANFNANTHTAKAVVFYVDNTGQHGWAIALQDAGYYAWDSQNSYHSVDTPLPNFGSKREAIYDLDGYENTRFIREYSTSYPAFYAVDFEHGWYLPAIGQLNYLYGNLKEVNVSLDTVGGSKFVGDWEIWSSTENNFTLSWYLNNSGDLCLYTTYYGSGHYNGKENGRCVRAVINF